MGVYINPSGETKESWLSKHGRMDNLFIWAAKKSHELPVVLMNNGLFTAAGIAYCEREFDEFIQPDDRPKIVFIVSIGDLQAVTGGELSTYLKL